MSSKLRNSLIILLFVLMIVGAFSAGYFANDLVGLPQSANAQENMDVYWQAWKLVNDNFIGELPTDQSRAYGAIRGSLQVLDDPYTLFVEPVARDREREQLQGSFGGIGAFISRPEGSEEFILEPIPGNPAEAAGILSGDVLIAVDDTAVTLEMTVSDVVNMIKGEKGTEVVLTVRHPDETETVDIAIVRSDILIPSVRYALLEEDEQIGYIILSRFSGESGEEVGDAITDLLAQDAKMLILDLRQNRGGLLDAAIDVADHFLEGGPVLFQQSNEEGERTFNATRETIASDIPLVVLVDSGSASAAEIVAGALQDRDRAPLIGASETFGKGSVQMVFDLDDGSSVHVTSARWYTPDRKQIDGQGLTPDLIVEVTQEAIDNGRDEVLQQAITYLQENLSES